MRLRRLNRVIQNMKVDLPALHFIAAKRASIIKDYAGSEPQVWEELWSRCK